MTEQEWDVCQDPQRMLRHFVDPPGEGARAKFRASPRKLRLFGVALADAYHRGDIDTHPAYQWIDGLVDPPQFSSTRWELYDLPASTFAANAIRHFTTQGITPIAMVVPAVVKQNRKRVSEADAADFAREVFGNPFRPVPLHSTGNGLDFELPATWLTPQVLTLAEAAYRDRVAETCEECGGSGTNGRGDGYGGLQDCPVCQGTGNLETGRLDPVTLAALADALEEGGCPVEVPCGFCKGKGNFDRSNSYAECPRCKGRRGVGTGRIPHPVLAHLRSPGTHYRGCHALDALLGKE